MWSTRKIKLLICTSILQKFWYFHMFDCWIKDKNVQFYVLLANRALKECLGLLDWFSNLLQWMHSRQAGQCSVFKTDLKSHPDWFVSTAVTGMAKNNWNSVKEDAFLSLYISPHPTPILFTFWQQFVSPHLQCFPESSVILFPYCLCGYFSLQQEKTCLKTDKCNF